MFDHRRPYQLRSLLVRFNPRDRRAWLVPALILLSAISGNASPFPPKQTAAALPEVLIGATRRDFGDVFAGEELEQNFPVRNVGAKPLELAEKSTLGSRDAEPDYRVTEAAWRPNASLFSPTAAARRAAPS